MCADLPLIRRWSSFFSIALAIQLLTVPPVLGQESGKKSQLSANPIISYQGRLTDGAGSPVPDTDHTLVFKLYNQKEGGSPLWQETQNIPTSNGVFSAQLGSVNPIENLDFAQTYYLGIEVDGGEELTPRTRLTDAPYAVRARSVDDDGVATTALVDGAVTSSKIEDRAITTDKFDYGAVDSAAIDPDAVTKTLRPLLEINYSSDFVGVNREEPVTGSDAFAIHSDVEFDDTFGGMYIDTEGAESWPFYGYATAGESHAWTVYDHAEKEWILEYDHTSPRHRLVVDESSVHPGGDNDVLLGTADHRWSEVHAANGTIQTSDRRLKTGISRLSYGLEEVLRLEPVSYRWKNQGSDSNAEADRHLGLIAQQVQDVVGEVVEQPRTDNGYLGMKYSELIPVLVSAVQQQQEIIEKQEEALRARDQQLKRRVEKLQRQVRALAEEIDDTRGGAQPVTTSASD